MIERGEQPRDLYSDNLDFHAHVSKLVTGVSETVPFEDTTGRPRGGQIFTMPMQLSGSFLEGFPEMDSE